MSKEQQHVTSEMWKGVQDVLSQLNVTLGVLVDVARAPRDLKVLRADGKVIGGESKLITH